MLKFVSVLASATIIGIASAQAAADDVIAKCSVTQGGITYIPQHKFSALAKNLASAKLAKFDKGCKGHLSDDENKLASKGERRDEAGYLVDLQDMARNVRPNTPGIPSEEARVKLKLDEEDEFKLPFLVRDAYSIHSLARPPKPRDEAEGAQFTYTRDISGRNDIVTATGAIIGWNVISLDSKKGQLPVPEGFTRMLFAPGIEFDQTRNRANPAKNVDYIGLRFIGELEKEGGIFDVQYLRYSGYLKTDSRGDSQIWGGYVEWQPYRLDLGIGGGRNIFGPAMLSISPLVHAEFEKVANAGPLDGIMTGDQYFRAGPIVVANMWFLEGYLRNLTLSAQYRYLANFGPTGHNHDVKYFQGTAAYNLDRAGNSAISVTYRDGVTPGNGTKVQDIKTGLTVKF